MMTVEGKVAYVAGPYRPYVDDEGERHSIARNVREAGNYGIEVWKRGYVALVPHTLTYLNPSKQRNDGSIKGIPAEAFMDGELELIRRSDFLIMLPEWKYSRGATAEREYALQLGLPVVEWEEFLESSGSRDAEQYQAEDTAIVGVAGHE